MTIAYIRAMARMATKVARPATMTLTRQAPAVTMARQYHAFRPTSSVLKGRKHAIADEDDEELEAELAELEREKRELEALERGELDSTSDSTEGGASQFQERYDTILNHTLTTSKSHEFPRSTSLYHLTQAITTSEQAQEMPALVAQWRSKALPITHLVTDKLIHAVCKAGNPEVALELLGDREKFALLPGQKGMRRVVRAFVRQIGEQEGQETEEGLAKLDNAFKVMALIPYYSLAADDASVYANLVRGSLLQGGEEGLRRASVTMDEYLLIDGEREKPLTKKRTAELLAAAELLSKAYEANGQAEKVKELQKPMAQWKARV